MLRNVWCWETLIFAVGYGEGAVFAGDAAVAHPNLFAQTVLVNGVPHDYLPAEELSDRWLLPDASADWQHKNREIPTAVWMLGNQDTAQAEAYFSRPGTDLVAVSKGDYGPAPETTAELLRQMNTRIRWKNSPDGTPARIKSQEQMLADGEYTRGVVHHNLPEMDDLAGQFRKRCAGDRFV